MITTGTLQRVKAVTQQEAPAVQKVTTQIIKSGEVTKATIMVQSRGPVTGLATSQLTRAIQAALVQRIKIWKTLQPPALSMKREVPAFQTVQESTIQVIKIHKIKVQSAAQETFLQSMYYPGAGPDLSRNSPTGADERSSEVKDTGEIWNKGGPSKGKNGKGKKGKGNNGGYVAISRQLWDKLLTFSRIGKRTMTVIAA